MAESKVQRVVSPAITTVISVATPCNSIVAHIRPSHYWANTNLRSSDHAKWLQPKIPDGSTTWYIRQHPFQATDPPTSGAYDHTIILRIGVGAYKIVANLLLPPNVCGTCALLGSIPAEWSGRRRTGPMPPSLLRSSIRVWSDG